MFTFLRLQPHVDDPHCLDVVVFAVLCVFSLWVPLSIVHTSVPIFGGSGSPSHCVKILTQRRATQNSLNCDLMRLYEHKKMWNIRTIILAAELDRDLCYASEN